MAGAKEAAAISTSELKIAIKRKWRDDKVTFSRAIIREKWNSKKFLKIINEFAEVAWW